MHSFDKCLRHGIWSHRICYYFKANSTFPKGVFPQTQHSTFAHLTWASFSKMIIDNCKMQQLHINSFFCQSNTPSPPVKNQHKSPDMRTVEVQTADPVGLSYQWNPLYTGIAIPEPQYGLGFVNPTPIACHVVSADALEGEVIGKMMAGCCGFWLPNDISMEPSASAMILG